MSLSLIVGPPNSGKAGAIRDRLEAALARDPILVVPTPDDADRFERELSDTRSGPVLGVLIATFARLFEEVAAATGVVLPPTLTDVQKLHVGRAATEQAGPRILARSAQRPGFAPALVSLVDELQAAAVDPRTLGARAQEAGEGRDYLGEIAALYAAYIEVRDGLGYGDAHLAAAQATAALRRSPDAWGARPVFLYGFDDLTIEQLELVGALARAAEVTFAVTYEDRRALAARARLLEELRQRGGIVEATLEPDAAHTESPTLFHLERSFLRSSAERIEPDDGLRLLEAAGELGEAEQVGALIAELLAGGTEPGEIAVVVRSPDRAGPLYRDVLGRFGIPVAAEARLPFTRTAVGRGLVALLRATLVSQRADEVLAFVRTPGVAPPADADWLERTIRRRDLRTAREALAAWNGRRLFEIEEVREGGKELPARLARLARRLAEWPLFREAPLGDDEIRLELRAAALAADALTELAELPALTDPSGEALATLEWLTVPVWRGASEGRVRVTSPYRIRARRVQHLFVTSLQEGEFPRHGADQPFLSDDQRAALALPPRAEPLDEERYLFYACLSRPTRRLYLSWRSCDDEGAEAAPSLFLDDVRALLSPPADAPGTDPLERRVVRRRLAEVTLPVAGAPTIGELTRALAPFGWPASGEVVERLGLTEAERGEAIAALTDAAARLNRRVREPGPLELEPVLAELRSRDLYGASTLEEYALCSYRWFVQHELSPEALEPEPEARAQGTLIHRVLERLYRNPPDDAGVPRPATLGAWRRRASELIDAEAAEVGIGGAGARAAASRARASALVQGFLEREARASAALVPNRELLEASFGKEGQRPALRLDRFGLHGQIDRVDVPAGGEAAGLVRDYKASRTVTKGANLEKEGKLQPQLYALALKELWDLRALGGLYQPLAATDDHRPRGVARRSEAEGLLAGFDLVGGDLLDDGEFDDCLRRAAERAAEIVSAMRAGAITRNPLDDRCPPYCTFQAICRRERAARQEAGPEGVDEEEEDE